jgi:hypothetical protein
MGEISVSRAVSIVELIVAAGCLCHQIFDECAS